jgi:hypothetical protein|tara:strand:- start:231 stop:470 length:240 start_codon:yes stop_codon:yes gene_type:complete
MNTIKKYWKIVINWIISLFRTRYKLTVSYNSTYGDADDQTFVVRKFYSKKEKYLKFLTENKEVVELRGAEGLNYRIEEI